MTHTPATRGALVDAEMVQTALRVDDAMARGWRNRFISAQTELNQRANGNAYELARAYAEATANEYEAALIAALEAAR